MAGVPGQEAAARPRSWTLRAGWVLAVSGTTWQLAQSTPRARSRVPWRWAWCAPMAIPPVVRPAASRGGAISMPAASVAAATRAGSPWHLVQADRLTLTSPPVPPPPPVPGPERPPPGMVTVVAAGAAPALGRAFPQAEPARADKVSRARRYGRWRGIAAPGGPVDRAREG